MGVRLSVLNDFREIERLEAQLRKEASKLDSKTSIETTRLTFPQEEGASMIQVHLVRRYKMSRLSVEHYRVRGADMP